jgi:hypothetical protein
MRAYANSERLAARVDQQEPAAVGAGRAVAQDAQVTRGPQPGDLLRATEGDRHRQGSASGASPSGRLLERGVLGVVGLDPLDLDLRPVGGVEAAQVPLLDPGAHVLAHAARGQGLAARDLGRIPAVRLAVDAPQLAIGGLERLAVRRHQPHQLALDEAHPQLGPLGRQHVGGVLPAAQPVGHRLAVVLLVEDGVVEVVGDGEHRGERRERLGLEARDPARDLGVRAAALQQRIAPDQLDLVEQHDPAGEAGGGHQARGEAEALQRQLARRDRLEGPGRGLAGLPEAPLQLGDADRVAGPEAHDPVRPAPGRRPAARRGRASPRSARRAPKRAS